MERAVRITEKGTTKIRYGLEICDGPKTYRLMLTHPVSNEGHIVEIPRDAIESIDDVAPGPRGESPKILEG